MSGVLNDQIFMDNVYLLIPISLKFFNHFKFFSEGAFRKICVETLKRIVLRSCPQKIAVVSQSGSRTIRDRIRYTKSLGELSESLLRSSVK